MAKGKPTDPLDPNFLIEHAERLTTSEGRGRPPTIDSRRAASAAYYSAYHAATGAVARFLFGESWLPGVRWLSHKAVIDKALRSLKVERETADYDRTQTVPRATARNLVGQANAVKEFFESDRVDDPDTKLFFALAALRA